MEIIYWTGYCDKERVEAITDIEKFIKRYGSLVDFKSFSGNSLRFNIKIGEDSLNTLYSELKEYMRMDEFEKPDSETNREYVVLLNLTFFDK